jgi:hypothetical protein
MSWYGLNYYYTIRDIGFDSKKKNVWARIEGVVKLRNFQGIGVEIIRWGI